MEGKKGDVSGTAYVNYAGTDEGVAVLQARTESVEIGDLIGHRVGVFTRGAKKGKRITGERGDALVDVHQKDAVTVFHKRVGDQAARGQRNLALGRESARKHCNVHSKNSFLSKRSVSVYAVCAPKANDAVVPAVIADQTVAVKAVLRAEVAQILCLIVADLKEEKSVLGERGSGVCEEGTVEDQSVRTAVQGSAGLGVELGLKRGEISGGNVGGIAKDGVQ